MAIPAIVAAVGRGAGGAAAQAGAMAKTTQSATQLVDAYNRVSAAGYMFKGQLEGMFGKVTGTATMAANALKGLADPLTALTELSNPAAVKQFTLAFSDAMAVMGRVALPVVNSLSGAMKIVGDAYARAEPFLLRVTQAVGRGINQIFGELQSVWKQNGPLIDMMTTAMTRAIKVGTQVASMFIKIVDSFMRVISTVAKLFGFKDYSKPDASAKGAAVRSVNISGDAESVAKDAQTKAFMQAMQPAGGVAESEVDILGGIRTTIADARDKLLTEIKNLPEALYKSLTPLGQMVIDAIPVPGKETIDKGRSIADRGGFGIAGMIASALTR